MRKTFISALLLLGAFPIGAGAQNPVKSLVDDFDTAGSVTFGYRFADISGYTPKFKQMFGLRDGFRMQDLEISGRAKEGKQSGIADSYQFTANGIGGEPFAGGHLRVRKANVYSFNLNYRQSYYYWDQNDSAAQPTGLRGLTANHDWATVRKWSSAQLDVQARRDLELTFEFGRNTHRGHDFVTRVIDYFGAPSSWGSFERANPYVISAPVDERSQRFTAGVNYRFRDWRFSYRAGYQSLVEDVRMTNAASPERSINIDDAATANELLTTALWTQYRRLRSPVSELSYTGQAAPKLTLRGGYIYYRHSGPANLDAAYTGVARTNTNGSVVAPYVVTESDRGVLREPIHVIDQGFSYEIRDWWTVHGDYRYTRFSGERTGSFMGTSTTGTTQGTSDAVWRYGMSALDTAFEFRPSRELLVRTGIRLMKRDVAVVQDGVVNAQATRRSKIVSPIGSVYYSPNDRLRIRADVQSFTNGGPYTRITPRTDITSRLMARYQVTGKLSIEDAVHVRDGKYTTSDFRNRYRSNGTTLNYQLSRRYGAFAGFTYDTFVATASITFLRGTAPLNATWRDQTVNRVWQAGVDAQPTDKLSLRLSGNYLRTTGVGEISGELPTAGPVKWPLVTGTLSYRFGSVGTFSLDLQRTYYVEEIVSGNNFEGNLLGIRWTREFGSR